MTILPLLKVKKLVISKCKHHFFILIIISNKDISFWMLCDSSTSLSRAIK